MLDFIHSVPTTAPKGFNFDHPRNSAVIVPIAQTGAAKQAKNHTKSIDQVSPTENAKTMKKGEKNVNY